MAVPPRISMVTLGVADVARATAFYESLGWRRSSASIEGTISFFTMQGSALALFGRDALADDARVDDARVEGQGSGFRAVTLALNCGDEAEVRTVFDEFVSAGARPVVEPHRADWGGVSGYVSDPDGHLWEIAVNPYSPNDESGRMQLPT